MSTVKTRRQSSKVLTPATPIPNGRQEHVSMNGNGTAHHAVARKDDHPHENIFLFTPNIIGLYLHASCYIFELTPCSRLFSYNSRYSIPLLHASSSTNLLPPIQYFVSA